jgi:hypothetical protein
VVGVRSMLAGLALPALLSATREAAVSELVESGMDPDEAARSVDGEPAGSDTSVPDTGAVTEEPPAEGHSSREALLRRIAAMKTTRPGLVSRSEGDSE